MLHLFARLRRAAALMAVALALLLTSPAAQGQSFTDYGMLGGKEAPTRTPGLEDYGAIADTYRATSALDMTQHELSRFRKRMMQVTERLPLLWDDIHTALERAAPGGDVAFFTGLAVFLVLLIGIGRAAGLIFAVYAARPVFVALQRAEPEGLCDKLPVLAARVGLVVVALAINLIVAVLIGAGFYPEDNDLALRTAIIAFAAYAALRLVDTLWRMILAPFLPAYRIPLFSDRDARRLYRWLYALSLLTIVSGALMLWLGEVGLRQESMAILHISFTFVEMAVALAAGWVNRHSISSAILDGKSLREASWLSVTAAALWGPAVIVYLGVTWTDLSYRAILGLPRSGPPVAVAFAVFMAALIVYALTVFVVERVAWRRRVRRMQHKTAPTPEVLDPLRARDPFADGGDIDSDDDEGGGAAPFMRPAARPQPTGGMRTFEDLARRVASLFALGAAFWSLTVILGGRAVFADGTILDLTQNVIDILFVGYVAYHAVRIWIDQKIEEEGGDELAAEPGDEGGGASAASRLATLLPLVRNFVLILIAVSVAIFAAMEIGVNVAPLLGGAGVIGLAIGFGSQTLVRDVLSGAFFLADDAFRKGEYIDIGGVKGTVEKISIRSFQLRHHLGALNTVPFGEIRHLTNFSRDWVIMKLPLRLTYDTDVEKVRKLIKKLGERLLDHPIEGRKFIQPLKSQGVYMMEDSAMIIRVKFMTRPGDQWTTRKLVYSEIRDMFEREGVHFAHREVTVRIPGFDDDHKLTEGEMKAIGAAARSVVDEADAAAATRPRAVGDDR